MSTRARLALAAIVVAVAATACTSGDDGAGETSPSTAASDSGDVSTSVEGDAVVEIERFEYRPRTIEVEAGDTVTWRNGDKIIHWVTAGTPDDATGAFMERMPGEGDTVTLAFDEPGEFTYFCTRHEFMRGSVVVR